LETNRSNPLFVYTAEKYQRLTSNGQFRPYEYIHTVYLLDELFPSYYNYNSRYLVVDADDTFIVNDEDTSGYISPDFPIEGVVATWTNASAVPVPTAAILFSPALIGFLGLRRRSKQS